MVQERPHGLYDCLLCERIIDRTHCYSNLSHWRFMPYDMADIWQWNMALHHWPQQLWDEHTGYNDAGMVSDGTLRFLHLTIRECHNQSAHRR
jgi:hypothetical protein